MQLVIALPCNFSRERLSQNLSENIWVTGSSEGLMFNMQVEHAACCCLRLWSLWHSCVFMKQVTLMQVDAELLHLDWPSSVLRLMFKTDISVLYHSLGYCEYSNLLISNRRKFIMKNSIISSVVLWLHVHLSWVFVVAHVVFRVDVSYLKEEVLEGKHKTFLWGQRYPAVEEDGVFGSSPSTELSMCKKCSGEISRYGLDLDSSVKC